MYIYMYAHHSTHHSLLFVKSVDFAEVGKQTVLQVFERFRCGRIIHCCHIVLLDHMIRQECQQKIT